MNFVSCGIVQKHATCDMRHATCDMRHATCDMRHRTATCDRSRDQSYVTVSHGVVWHTRCVNRPLGLWT
jgi:hypothetical protein